MIDRDVPGPAAHEQRECAEEESSDDRHDERDREQQAGRDGRVRAVVRRNDEVRGGRRARARRRARSSARHAARSGRPTATAARCRRSPDRRPQGSTEEEEGPRMSSSADDGIAPWSTAPGRGPKRPTQCAVAPSRIAGPGERAARCRDAIARSARQDRAGIGCREIVRSCSEKWRPSRSLCRR